MGGSSPIVHGATRHSPWELGVWEPLAHGIAGIRAAQGWDCPSAASRTRPHRGCTVRASSPWVKRFGRNLGSNPPQTQSEVPRCIWHGAVGFSVPKQPSGVGREPLTTGSASITHPKACKEPVGNQSCNEVLWIQGLPAQRSRRQRVLGRGHRGAVKPLREPEEPAPEPPGGAEPGQGLRYLEHVCQMLERLAKLQQDNRLLRQQAGGARSSRPDTTVRAGSGRGAQGPGDARRGLPQLTSVTRHHRITSGCFSPLLLSSRTRSHHPEPAAPEPPPGPPLRDPLHGAGRALGGCGGGGEACPSPLLREEGNGGPVGSAPESPPHPCSFLMISYRDLSSHPSSASRSLHRASGILGASCIPGHPRSILHPTASLEHPASHRSSREW
uniref:DUF4657 domain-containing protein n=1 Tax=Melopsittacus undulatus TaxID=13146 RepID=A0A8V5GZ55_MELUD